MESIAKTDAQNLVNTDFTIQGSDFASYTGRIATQSKTSTTEEVKRTFSFNIKVKAVQAAPPSGATALIDALTKAIIDDLK